MMDQVPLMLPGSMDGELVEIEGYGMILTGQSTYNQSLAIPFQLLR